MDFRWIEWNLEHVAKHGVEPQEAASVVDHAKPPYPQDIGNEKYLAVGHGNGGRLIQVIYLVDDDATVFVIHARPLTDREKRRFRRRSRP